MLQLYADMIDKCSYVHKQELINPSLPPFFLFLETALVIADDPSLVAKDTLANKTILSVTTKTRIPLWPLFCFLHEQDFSWEIRDPCANYSF